MLSDDVVFVLEGQDSGRSCKDTTSSLHSIYAARHTVDVWRALEGEPPYHY